MRVFVVIASGEYTSFDLPNLNGAIKDGNDIVKILLDPSLGDYSEHNSKFLCSPVLSEVQQAFNEILAHKNSITCLTIYFAGHGISHRGAYYFCVKNTEVECLSTTALPLNYIFNFINDVEALQTNVIIDACEAGGLVGDIGALVKPEVFGIDGTSSISLFASSMRNESASENINGGYATQTLLNYIRGDISIDTQRPYLDLAVVGRYVSERLINEKHQQTPSSWGFNLTGISSFSKNPHFQQKFSSNDLPIFLSADVELLQEEKNKLWFEYLRIHDTGVTYSLVELLVASVKSLKQKGMRPNKIALFILGTAEGMASRVSDRQDIFSATEVLAACGVAFLPILDEDDVIGTFTLFIDRLLATASNGFNVFLSDYKNGNSLLGGGNIIGDLYFLPVRITKLLGWMGLIQSIQNSYSLENGISDEQIETILELIYKDYTGSMVCVSDEQAPYLFLFTLLNGFQKREEKFILAIRLYFNDFIASKGKILTNEAKGADILNYLMCRYHGDYSGIDSTLAQPSELLSVILYGAAKSHLDDDFNSSLIKIDHTSLNVFVPKSISDFWMKRIEGGVNISIQVGNDSESGIFTIEDFRRVYSKFCLPKIATLGNKREMALACVFMSFTVPDRVTWFFENNIDLKDNLEEN